MRDTYSITGRAIRLSTDHGGTQQDEPVVREVVEFLAEQFEMR